MISADTASTILSTTGYSTASLASLGAAPKISAMSTDQVNAVSKDFESLFIAQMMEQMFGDSQGSEAFGSSDTNDVYKAMMMDQYGKQIAKAGGIGIADYVKRELLKLQEK